MSKKEVRYQITPLGLLGQETLDKLLLFMVKSDNNAIVWDSKELIWAKVQWRKDVSKTPRTK